MNIVHFVDLDLAAVGQRRDRQLALWYALRVADPTGIGRLLPEQIQDTCCWLRMSPRLSARVLRGGTGTFWRIARNGIVYLQSPTKVAVALGVSSFRAAFCVPLTDLRGSLSTVRAKFVMRAVAALRDGRPISNATIAEMACTSSRTVTAWKRIAKVRARENFVLVAPLRPGTIAGDFRHFDPALRTVRFRGRRWAARRIADSFATPQTGGVRSHLRRANRRLRALSEQRGRDPARHVGGARHPVPADASQILPYTLQGQGRKGGSTAAVQEPVIPLVSGGSFVHGVRAS